MTQVANRNEKFVVSINTPSGPAFIESEQQWNEVLEMDKYIGLLKSNRVTGTNRVYISAVCTDLTPDEKRKLRRTA